MFRFIGKKWKHKCEQKIPNTTLKLQCSQSRIDKSEVSKFQKQKTQFTSEYNFANTLIGP